MGTFYYWVLLNSSSVAQTTSAVTISKEIVMLLIGAAIAILSGICTYALNAKFNRLGKLRLYTKIVYSKAGNHPTWGVEQGGEGLYFQVPLWIEIHNTSNEIQIVRNFNLWLYNNKVELCPMVQINAIGENVMANDGTYSFLVEPKSIVKFDCQFTIKKVAVPNQGDFDEIRIAYFDSKDKRHIQHFQNVENCWDKSFKRKADNDWHLLEEQKLK